jgi:hypothetical protein
MSAISLFLAFAQAALAGLPANWTAVPAETVPPPAVEPVEIEAAEPEEPEEPPHPEHNPAVHMILAQRAAKLYASRYDGGELGRFIGETKGDQPASKSHDTIVAGTYEEDKPFANPFNQMVPVMRHFWDCRGGDRDGLWGFDSSVNRAQKYWTGGFGLKGAYDARWSSGGKLAGTKGLGAPALYRKGEKGKAFWYVGHMAHFVQDLTIPAHTLHWPHPGNMDAYEPFARENQKQWPSVASQPLEHFDSPRALMAATCAITNRYDAGTGKGALKGKDGEADKGGRREGGFTEAELVEELNELIPLAVRRVAALYLLFFKAVDQTAPTVTLRAPERLRSGEYSLAADARDRQSGVDLAATRYQWRERGGRWLELAGALFTPPGPGDYELRARAVDAVGNAAWSRPIRLKAAAPDALVALRR